jgi:hypothetical protein
MNDEETLAALRSSLTGAKESLADVHLDCSADAIRARARGRRLRHGMAGAGAAGVALGVGLAVAVGGGSPATARSVHVNLDAWSVNTLPGGLVYVDVRELVQPDLLRQTLAQAGVPATVTFGEFCTNASAGQAGNLDHVLGKDDGGGEPKLTINPAAIPAGSELTIGITSVPVDKPGSPGHAFDTSFALVKEGLKLTCGNPPAGDGGGKKGPGASPEPGTSGATGGTGIHKTGWPSPGTPGGSAVPTTKAAS